MPAAVEGKLADVHAGWIFATFLLPEISGPTKATCGDCLGRHPIKIYE